MIALSESGTRAVAAGGATEAPAAATSPIRRILVATRGTPVTSGALRVARALAERTGASCELLTVHEPRIPLPEHEDLPRREWYEPPDRVDAAQLVRRVRRQRRSVLGEVPCWPVRLEVGYPPRVIARVARQMRADLVIVGLGRTEPSDRRFGSETGLRLSMLGAGAVLVVPREQQSLPRRALVVVDRSRPDSFVAEQALALLAEPATLWLAQLVPAHDAARSPKVVDAAAAELEKLCRRLLRLPWAPHALELRRAVITAGSIEQLLRFVEAERIELIATPVHGSTFEERVVMSNVVAPLFRSAWCSLLAAPESEARASRATWEDGAGVESRWRPGPQPGTTALR
ncbi:MAG TPA: universal stress protein [Gemmatimonadaceae bacterium]|nr:universal stress protein [Gemmatimonadaceae bacterium]